MYVQILKSKIHCATVTEANLEYGGSLTIDNYLIEAAGIFPGERAFFGNNNTAVRVES